MTLWELIRKGAEEGLEALKDGVSVLMAETGKTSRILKKRVELTSVQGNVRKAFIRLGSLAYELHSKGDQEIYDNAEVKALLAQIDDYKARVRDMETEIEKIKREEKQKAAPQEPPPSEPQPPVSPER
jgi:chromosome segregation ATPase